MAIPKKESAGRKRQKNVSGGRQHMVGVWVSEPERQRLRELAAGQGQSVPRLLLERAFVDDAGLTRSDHELLQFYLRGLIAEVNRVGVNLNQIARATNAAESLPHELREPLVDAIIVLGGLANRAHGIYDEIERGQTK